MSPDTLKRALVRQVPVLRSEQEVGDAVREIVESGLPALPVVDGAKALYGVFGERELIGALFPGYFQELRSARFIPHSIDEVIEQRLECRHDPVGKYANTEQVAAGPDWSDAQLAETFLHHRVLIVPVLDERGRVHGVVTRSDFFKALGERLTQRE
ncbi:MAG: CBS domain-containing protein [Thermoleophilaceae bacterium]|jgi:CBS-domain-containing membrane protein|nr:CBS domain-containing protein [Thermoleophilaceae bacterium]